MYADLAGDIEKRFDTSNFEVERPQPIEKNKAVIKLMNNELGRQKMNKMKVETKDMQLSGRWLYW